MDLIILNDGLYQLVPVTKQMMEHMSLLVDEIDLFELCDILRQKLTTYHDYPVNAHVMKMAAVIFLAVYGDNTYPIEREISKGR